MDNTKRNSMPNADGENLLKPCPFCGAPLLIEYNMKENGGRYEIKHTCFTHKRGNYLACADIVFCGDTKREVAELWNRRAGR